MARQTAPKHEPDAHHKAILARVKDQRDAAADRSKARDAAHAKAAEKELKAK